MKTRYWNLAAAILVAMLLTAFMLLPAFASPVDGDFVAYALPSANWIERGVLALPQLCTQYDLDRYWRFNSPLMGAGAALPFLIGGVSHASYAAGLAALILLTTLGVSLLCRRAVGGPPARWLLVAAALLSIRSIHNIELINQRYTIIAPLMLGLLFFPGLGVRTEGGARWWKWSLAGALPLIHPALLPGSVIWALAEVRRVVREQAVSRLGLTLFACGVAGCGWWYLTPPGFRSQFLPHLTARDFAPFSGWDQAASWKYALPSQLMQLIVIGCAALVVPSAARVDRGRRVLVILAAMVIADLFGRMMYLGYYSVGLAPAVLWMVRDRRWFPHVVRSLLVLAVVNAAVFVKLTPGRPTLPTSQVGAEEFVVAHTRAGERMCLGPPFTLVAAKSELSGGRVPVFVVPTALYLRDFDEPAFLASIRTGCTVYIGFPEAYTGVQKHYRPSSPPVFLDAVIEELEFEGRRVIVARARP